MLLERSLSRIWDFRVMHVALILLRRFMYPRCISVSVLFFYGVTSVALVITSTITIMYLYPRCLLKGKRPVWSENIFLLAS